MSSPMEQISAEVVEAVFVQLDGDCDWIISKDHAIKVVADLLRARERAIVEECSACNSTVRKAKGKILGKLCNSDWHEFKPADTKPGEGQP